MIEDKDIELKTLSVKIEKTEALLKERKTEVNDMTEFQKIIPMWKEEFGEAPIERQKMMIAQVIDNITVTREKVDIDVKLHISEFLANFNNKEERNDGVCNRLNRESATLAVWKSRVQISLAPPKTINSVQSKSWTEFFYVNNKP